MRIILFCGLLLGLVACNTNDGGSNNSAAVPGNAATDTANFTSIQWLDSVQSIGDINFGETVQIKFHFKNSGEKPLFIITAQPGCGCTVADYPKHAIAKGEEGEIIAAFDTNKGQPGNFQKSISVTTNTKPNGNSMLFFEGTIKPKPGEENERKPVAGS